MGDECLFLIFLRERVNDLQKALMRHGIDGLLSNFEEWLRTEELIDPKAEADARERRTHAAIYKKVVVLRNDAEAEMYKDAVKIVKELGQISVPVIQRRLKIGYNTAIEILTHLQNGGIVEKPAKMGGIYMAVKGKKID